MLEKYRGSYIKVRQLVPELKSMNMTPKAIFRWVIEKNIAVYVEGLFIANGESIDHWQLVKREVLARVIGGFDENLNLITDGFDLNYLGSSRLPFGVGIIDSNLKIKDSGFYGFHPLDFLLKVCDVNKEFFGSPTVSKDSSREENKTRKDNEVLKAFLAEVLYAIESNKSAELFNKNGLMKGKLAKILEDNINFYPNLVDQTGEKIPGTSAKSCERILKEVAELFEKRKKPQ